jgi:hypothetical protein
MLEMLQSTHLVATLFMTGLIWFVQVVHYPLMARVGEDRFVDYETAHTRRTGWVVGPPMLLELLTAIALTVIAAEGQRLLRGFALLLLLLIWAITAFVQVPQHRRLAQGYDAQLQRQLVNGNWLRVLLWSLRALLIVIWF